MPTALPENIRSIFGAAVAVLVVGCAGTPPSSAPGQRPEVTIVGSTRKQVLDAIVEAMLAGGAELERIDDHTAVFGKRDDSLVASAGDGSRTVTRAEMRITFGTVETPSGLRVYTSGAIVRNPGSAAEAVTDVTGGDTARAMQGALERLRSRLQEANASSKPPIATSRPSAPSSPPSARGSPPFAPSPQPSTASAQSSVPSLQSSATSSQSSGRASTQDRGAIPKVAAESRYLILAQDYARDGGCASPVATMNLRAGWAETFTITCATGDARTVRCEYGTCRDLK
jgi:hypothetical protein